MKKTWLYVFIGLIVVGSIVAYFSNNPIVDLIAFAVACGSAGVLCGKLKRTSWKDYVATICLGLGAFGVCFCGVAPDTVSKLISAIIAVILLIAGFFCLKKAE